MFADRYKKIFLIIGITVMVLSCAITFKFGLNLGIDFTGGSLTESVYTQRPDKQALEQKLDTLDLGGYSLRESVDDAGRDGYILRTRDLSEADRVTVAKALTSVGTDAQVTRFTSIGPVIGQELKDKAVWAILAVVIVIILYVAFAFRKVSYPIGSWAYGGITIFALLHDVLVPTALMSLLGHFLGVEVDVLFVMALLAVLGYSVNDTIVVFDRVRENLIKNRTEKHVKKNVAGVVHDEVTYKLDRPFGEIVGTSVSETMARSINTSLTTLLSLCALFYFGADVTQTFALILIAGVIAGTYSSVCLANPLLIYIAQRYSKENKK